LKLSVVMPVYNERHTIRDILSQVRAVDLEKEIVCVDDFSTDGTWEILQEEAKNGTRVLRHSQNMGKGAAVRTGLERVEGDVVIIQDADLEYDPQDYHALLDPIRSGQAKVVYGSRFLGSRRDMAGLHSFGNQLVTATTNLLFGVALTDMETCYKVFTADVAGKIRLTSPRWGFDPEITARILKLGHRIHEVPINYRGREHSAGKKLSWKDGFTVMFTLLRCRLSD